MSVLSEDIAKISSHVRMCQLSNVLVVIVFLQADDGSAATTTVTPLDSTSHHALLKAVVCT